MSWLSLLDQKRLLLILHRRRSVTPPLPLFLPHLRHPSLAALLESHRIASPPLSLNPFTISFLLAGHPQPPPPFPRPSIVSIPPPPPYFSFLRQPSLPLLNLYSSPLSNPTILNACSSPPAPLISTNIWLSIHVCA